MARPGSRPLQGSEQTSWQFQCGRQELRKPLEQSGKAGLETGRKECSYLNSLVPGSAGEADRLRDLVRIRTGWPRAQASSPLQAEQRYEGVAMPSSLHPPTRSRSISAADARALQGDGC